MTGHRDGVHRDPIDPLPGRGDRRERTARAAVLEHAAGEHRRHFPTLLHVGAPLGRATVVPAEHGGDHALRTDVLGALLWRRRHEAPLVWLEDSFEYVVIDGNGVRSDPVSVRIIR